MALAGDHLVAGADAEQLVGERHGLARKPRRHERPGVDVAVTLHAARHQHPREWLGRRQLQEGVVLVVTQEDVVLRAPLLDEIVLERQRLDYRVGDDELEADDIIEEGVGLRTRPVGPQVVADPVAERSGLTHVNGLASLVEVQVDPGLLWQPGYLLLEIADGHTVLWRDYSSTPNPP